jgi:integrase
MRVSERAGLKDGMTAHTLRHTYASVLLSKGAPLTGVAKQLGHKNPDITARVYSHVINREQQDAVSRF